MGVAGRTDEGLWMTSVASGMEVAAKKQQQLAQNAALEWNASVSEREAKVYDTLAGHAEKAGQNEAKEIRYAYDALRGEQRAGYAAAGVDVNYGTAANAQADTVAWGEYEAQKAIYNGSMKAFEYKNQSINSQLQAVSSRAGVQSPNMAAYIISAANNVHSAYEASVDYRYSFYS